MSLESQDHKEIGSQYNLQENPLNDPSNASNGQLDEDAVKYHPAPIRKSERQNPGPPQRYLGEGLFAMMEGVNSIT